MAVHVPQPPKRPRTFALEAYDLLVPSGGSEDHNTPSHLEVCVRPGELLAIFGLPEPDGRALLASLSGLTKPSQGRVLVEGTDLGTLDEVTLAAFRERRLGFIAGSCSLIGTLTVEKNAQAPNHLCGEGRFDPARRALEVLEVVGLSHRRAVPCCQLSPCEQCRLAVACALAHDPAILIAGDPTAELESEDGRMVRALLLGLARRAGKTMVMTTNDALTAQGCDRVMNLSASLIPSTYTSCRPVSHRKVSTARQHRLRRHPG